MRFFKNILLSLCLIMPSSLALSKSIVLTEHNHTAIIDTVDDASVSEVIKFLNLSEEKEVYLYLDSPGGSVFAGLKLVEALKSTNKTVTCIVQEASSMAFVITQACHKRLITSTGTMMQHVSSYGLRGQEPNNFSFAQFIRKVSQSMDEEQARRLGMSYKEFRDLVRDDWWLYGKEAVEKKAADGITSVSCNESLSRKVKVKNVQVLFFRVKLYYSACPLVTGELEVQTSKGEEVLENTPKEVLEHLQNKKTFSRENGYTWDQ